MNREGICLCEGRRHPDRPTPPRAWARPELCGLPGRLGLTTHPLSRQWFLPVTDEGQRGQVVAWSLTVQRGCSAPEDLAQVHRGWGAAQGTD